MKADKDAALLELVTQVRASDKYAAIDVELVTAIGRAELSKRGSLKEAVKSTRNKLHQVGSAYQEVSIPYARWKAQLADLPSEINDPAVQTFLAANRRMHASTQERESIASTFFKETLAALGPVESVLDLACGLNPLNIGSMPLAQGCSYLAVDIYADMVDYLNLFFGHFGIKGTASLCDLTRQIPQQQVQVAFLLKTIPCLEQIDKSAGQRLLEGINAANILVSFPSRSLGGRSKGMAQNYEAHFNHLMAGKNWQVTRFEFAGELAFLVRK